jgi:hypothetical protein
MTIGSAAAIFEYDPDAIAAPERFVCGNQYLDSDRAGQWYERLARYATATGSLIVEDEITIAVPPSGGPFRPHHPLGVHPLAVIASCHLRQGIGLRPGGDDWTDTRLSLVCDAAGVRFRAWVIGIKSNLAAPRVALSVVPDRELETFNG